jgi:DNA-binding NarL/FixJ family response regulator
VKLLPREKQVIECASRGLSAKETGRELGISDNTVRVYRHQAMKKMGTSRIVVAVLMMQKEAA